MVGEKVLYALYADTGGSWRIQVQCVCVCVCLCVFFYFLLSSKIMWLVRGFFIFVAFIRNRGDGKFLPPKIATWTNKRNKNKKSSDELHNFETQ